MTGTGTDRKSPQGRGTSTPAPIETPANENDDGLPWRRGSNRHDWCPAGCQFIAGEPSHTDRGKCGKPVSGNTAYCEVHRALCHLPPPEAESF